jgi:pheromone shutdown protein TraB
VIVAEGVGGDSVLTRALGLAYRTTSGSKRLGLVVQDINIHELARAVALILRPDLSGEQVRRGWRTVPWVQRLVVLTLVPVLAVGMRILGSRRVLGRFLATDDLPTLEDHAVRETLPALTKFIADDRDKMLADELVSILTTRADEDILVGVVYGAAHMTAVVEELALHGYRPRSAEWLTVFDFD